MKKGIERKRQALVQIIASAAQGIRPEMDEQAAKPGNLLFSRTLAGGSCSKATDNS